MISQKVAQKPLDAIKQEDILDLIEDNLRSLGESRLDSAPYDTAWVARLAPHFPGWGFERALDWLREHQLPDGSWGGEILYYHDRFVCTLAALIALRTTGRGSEDERRIEQGEQFLWKNLGRLHFDIGDTIGFPVLAVSLNREAHREGLDVPKNVTHNVAIIEKKLNLLGYDPARWRYTSMSFSLEAVPPYLPDQAAFASTDFILDNGSIGTSPAATAAYLLHTGQSNERLLNYLSSAMAQQGDHGVPDIIPAEVFEISWSLYQLLLANSISPDHPIVRQHLDMLWQRWSPENGVSCSEFFPVPDLDDTATVFSLLRWGGYPVDAGVFEYYDGDRHFKCYPGEADFSLSVNIRTLAALQTERNHSNFETWSQKIGSMLRHYDLDHHLWFDKWHISPYYLTSVAICALHGVLDELLPPRIRWITKTQKADGGWGYFGHSTHEETALCLQALLFWDRNVEQIDPASLEAAAQYLWAGNNSNHHPPFYIGKCLYMPSHVVRATILSALYSYTVYKEA